MKDKQPVPPKWAALQKALLVARLTQEQRALIATRRAVQQVGDRVARELAQDHRGDAKQTVTAAISIVQRHLATMTDAVAGAVHRSRLDAKAASLHALSNEWEQVRAELRPLGFLGLRPFPHFPIDAAEDRAGAAIAATSFAAAWAASMMAALYRWSSSDEPTDVGAVTTETAKAIDYRVARIAATETGRAFADVRDDGAGWVADEYGDADWFPALLKRWDATLDSRTCRVCRAHDGEVQVFGLPFEGDEEPGDIHSQCRCVVGTIFLPIRIRIGEPVPGFVVDDEHPRTPDEVPLAGAEAQ